VSRTRARRRRIALPFLLLTALLLFASSVHDSDVAAAPQQATHHTHAAPAPQLVASSQPTGIVWRTESATVAGLLRTWSLAAPLHPLSARLPLIVVLHGRGSPPLLEAERSGLLTAVSTGHVIEAYPAGYDLSWNAGTCCGVAHERGINDVAFLRALVQRLTAQTGVDPHRVVLAGFSNGAKMALDMACGHRLDNTGVTLRAIVVVAASAVSPCAAGPSVPVIQVAGTHDPLVPYDAAHSAPSQHGASALTPVVTEFAAWRAAAACGSATTTRDGSLIVASWSCRGGPMELVTATGGGHGWPSGATEDILAFLAPLLTDPSIAQAHAA
jgi:polyhydroxybutyrate depolymerase